MEGENTVVESVEEIKNDEDSLLSRMRTGRTSSTTAFMIFVQANKYHATHAFCFYEGEDGAYYDPRIEEYLDDENRFITVVAGNKKNVLKVMEMISADGTYDFVRKMFFVDHDFDNPQTSHRDLFETPGYSVENFYVGEDAFCRILRTAFYINESDPDFQPCLNLYRETFRQFHEVILPFNARVKYQHQYAAENKGCCFGQVRDTSHIAHITIKEVKKSTKCDERLNTLDRALRPDVQILAKIEQDLRENPTPHNTYRGKNELYCLIKLLEEMRKEYNAPEASQCGFHFSTKQERNVKFTANEYPLGTLSCFASTPQSLIDFIVAHRPISA